MRAGGELDARVIEGCLRTKLAVVAEDERDSGRARRSTWGTRSGTRSRLPPATAAIATARRWGSACWPRCGCQGRDALRAEVAELLAARGLPLSFDSASVDDVLALVDRDKKRAGGRVPFVLVEAPGEVTPGHEVGAAELRAAIEEVLRRVKKRVEVLHGVNFDVLGRRDPDHYGGITLTELEVKVQLAARELGLDVSFSQTNHEGEYCEYLHRAGE